MQLHIDSAYIIFEPYPVEDYYLQYVLPFHVVLVVLRGSIHEMSYM